MKVIHLRYLFVFVSVLLFGDGLSAQEIDSISVQRRDSVLPVGNVDWQLPEQKPFYAPRLEYGLAFYGSEVRAVDFRVRPAIPGEAGVYSWGTGGFYGVGSSNVYNGLMGVDNGGFLLKQNYGRLSLSLDAHATKYGYFRGVSTSYGFGGSLSYRINDKLSFTLLGEYNSNPNIYQPAIFEVVRRSSVGGLFDYRINDNWGVVFGGQAYHSLTSGHWDVRPTVMPYYLVGGKFPISVDVGGILFGILDSISDKEPSMVGGNGGNSKQSGRPSVPVGTYPLRPKK